MDNFGGEIMITAHCRGWDIYYDTKSQVWRYKDTNEILNDNDNRPCKRCGRRPTKEGYDACLGRIPNATSACCGHGVEEPYIVYER